MALTEKQKQFLNELLQEEFKGLRKQATGYVSAVIKQDNKGVKRHFNEMVALVGSIGTIQHILVHMDKESD